MYKLRIAFRYLFSKKSTNAINVVTWVSMLGMGVGAFALVIVLSVFNGFEDNGTGLTKDEFYSLVSNPSFIQQEQVKKFAELQERLNNKEFLEGAKNAFESSEELQQFGTQEQYNDYIARVSLGIIKNLTSGEYNDYSKLNSKVNFNNNPNNKLESIKW